MYMSGNDFMYIIYYILCIYTSAFVTTTNKDIINRLDRLITLYLLRVLLYTCSGIACTGLLLIVQDTYCGAWRIHIYYVQIRMRLYIVFENPTSRAWRLTFISSYYTGVMRLCAWLIDPIIHVYIVVGTYIAF